jgi:hypothetical protein
MDESSLSKIPTPKFFVDPFTSRAFFCLAFRVVRSIAQRHRTQDKTDGSKPFAAHSVRVKDYR